MNIKFDISIKENFAMIYKFLLSIFLVGFISACTTTPKDEASSSGTGSSDVSSESAAQAAQTEITPGSQDDLIVNVGDRVFFGYNISELDSDAQELLQDQVAWIKQHNVSVAIEGHCDERGTREYNLALGEKRAQAVKNYLISMGVDSVKITTISYGKERPAVVGSNDGAWSQNRRSVTTVN